MKTLDQGPKRFAGGPTKQSKCVQVMYINFRVRIAFAPSDSLCSIAKRVSIRRSLSIQLVDFFGIEKSPEDVGLLLRVREKNYTYIWDTPELVPDCLYFLYFKENGHSRDVSQSNN